MPLSWNEIRDRALAFDYFPGLKERDLLCSMYMAGYAAGFVCVVFGGAIWYITSLTLLQLGIL